MAVGRVLVKPGVLFTTVAPAGYQILAALKIVARVLVCDLTITSACDGKHSGPDDPHHTGEAYDIRTHDLPGDLTHTVLARLRELLGPHFYAFLEDAGTDNEHLHVQRKKGLVYTVDMFLSA